MVEEIEQRIRTKFPEFLVQVDKPDNEETGFWWFDISNKQGTIVLSLTWSNKLQEIGVCLNDDIEFGTPSGVTPGDKLYSKDNLEEALTFANDYLQNPTHSL